MTNERNALKAGLFIVISIALILAIVVGIKGYRRFLEPVQKHQVRFRLSDDIGGLANGDPVRIGGANVGTVRDIELETDSPDPGINITFAIPRRFKVHGDAVLAVQTTITGVSVLNFESLGTGAMLAEGSTLTGKPAASFAQLAAAAQGVMTDVRTTTLPKINDTVDTYRGTGQHATIFVKYLKSKIDPIVEKYNQITSSGTSALDQIGSLFGDTKPDFKATMASLNASTASIKEKLPAILEKVDGTLTKVSEAMDKTNSALGDIQKVAGDAKDAASGARSIIVANRSKIDGMIASLKTAGDNLKFATAEIRRSPWRLLYKPGSGEMANLNLYDSARQFAEGANSMSDAAQALRDALKDPRTDPKLIETLVEQLDNSFQNFNKVESTLWKQVEVR